MKLEFRYITQTPANLEYAWEEYREAAAAFAWFGDVLARIPSHSIQKLDELLPPAWVFQGA